MERKARVMVVDDSAFMRKAITRIIQTDSAFEVIATADNGQDALDLLSAIKPDVITMDVEMPGMNGLEALKLIRQKYTIPVIIVSSLAQSGTDMAIHCLEAGAFDVVCKPESYVSMNISEISTDLHRKLKAAVCLPDDKLEQARYEKTILPSDANKSKKRKHFIAYGKQRLITIGSSTGGPAALNKLLSVLPESFEAGIVIVQHMPPGGFIQSLTERLNSCSGLNIRMAKDGDTIKNGLCLIAPIGEHVIFEEKGSDYILRMTKYPKDSLHCPSVSVLFESAGLVARENNISCILTGMGSDGVKGLYAVREHGGWVIAESEETAMIYGMPRCAVEAGLANDILALEKIPGALINLLQFQSVMSDA
ncbi:chemotaxis response regulator protein-glutamate methylesterase [bacterium]|nr:chemotaxis response regulator protein-glutamate methylesterase [bacterium]